MMRRNRSAGSRWTLLGTALAVTLFATGCTDTTPTQVDAGASSSAAGPALAFQRLQDLDLGPARAAQAQYGASLMAIPDVVGHGIAVGEDGSAAIVVFTLRAGVEGIPSNLNGVPTRVVASGMFTVLTDETAKHRPAPLGVSIGHPDITAGTLGFKVKDGSGNPFILSNNHVMANQNKASIGDDILQPGPYDGGKDPDDKIADLAAFVPIDFSGGNNVVDAAIASVTSSDVLSRTPLDEGYQQPSSTTQAASLGLPVQKYGRTTEETHGVVDAINVTADICYQSQGPFFCRKLARFVNQIIITPGSFSAGGDSGSGIVTETGNNPVGLLFAGSSSYTIANPIDDVLAAFGVSVDDGSGESSGSGTTNQSPTAAFTYSCAYLSCNFDATGPAGSSDPDGSIQAYDWDFGDGNTGTGATPSHSYGAGDTYTVVLTVTDNDDATDQASHDVAVSEPPAPGSLTLAATGYKVKGLQKADLAWSGATSVDIYRDGGEIQAGVAGGAYTDNIDQHGGGQYTYQVCESGGSTCSNQATVIF